MGKVAFNMTMSLDGFVAGPNDSPENGLGDGGDGLFTWYFSGETEVVLVTGESDAKQIIKLPQMIDVNEESMRAISAIFGPRNVVIR